MIRMRTAGETSTETEHFEAFMIVISCTRMKSIFVHQNITPIACKCQVGTVNSQSKFHSGIYFGNLRKIAAFTAFFAGS